MLSVSRGCCLGTVLPATMLCQPGLGGRSSFCGLYGIPFLRTLALMLRQVSFPVKSSQFLRRGWPPLPLVPLLLSSGLGVQPGPSSSWPPYPALWQAEGWQCLSPHVYSTLTEGDKAAPMGLNWSCQGGQRSDGYHRTPSCLSPVKNKACLPGLCWAPSSSL